METSLFTVGLILVIAAIVGGGTKAFGVELPALQSLKRQIILAFIGITIMVGPLFS
jgi:hypothetical protein